MRHIVFAAAVALVSSCGGLSAQTAAPGAPLPLFPSAGNDPDVRIEWEVKNRFRLFRNEADFQRHVASSRGDSVLAAENRLARESDGRGWARDMVDRLCIDQSGRLPETCERDGEKENFLAPQDHRIGVLAAGAIPMGATCAWAFDDGEGDPRTMTVPCEEEVRLRVRYGRATVATVDVTSPSGLKRSSAEIKVSDMLIAGLGDSVAAGEGNPDRPVALADDGFCYRRFFGGSFSEYFRPGRVGYNGDRACAPVAANVGSASGNDANTAWSRSNATWLSAACHRSLYGYQMRASIALAVQSPHIAVTFLPLACSGATIDDGFFGSQRARECPARGSCATSAPAQLTRLKEALALARKHQPARGLDLALLTIGANDINFSGLVGNVIVEGGTERVLFNRGGLIAEVADSQKILNTELPGNFSKLRAALKPLVGGNLARVIFVSYGHPALQADGTPCQGGRDGFDVHPALGADPERLRVVADFVSTNFLPRMRALALCESGVICKDPPTDRMTFVDSHQAAFAEHGFCARADTDPPFDRECFSTKGESFVASPAEAASDPMACSFRASDFRPYASRARWIRTANDSYFTAMTYPIGQSAVLQPSDIHDATWGATSAVYGGAIHPTAEGHAAMADAALPAMRSLLGLPPIETVRAGPLPPVEPQTR